MIKLKNENDIKKLRESGRILAETFQEIKKQIEPGITTLEIDKIAENYLIGRKVKAAFKGYMGYPASICVSVNDEVIHGIPGKRVLKNGDIISLDFGVNLDGYISDSAVTFPIGEISEADKKLIKITEECLYRGIEQAIAKNRVSNISKAVFTHAKKNNYGVVRDFCGHGVGFSLHEEPQIPNYINSGPNPRLKKGMVIAIEPMINIGTDNVYTLEDGWTVKTGDNMNSAHFEHTIAIYEDHAEIMTAL
jgi:methionyl aminopeptidase